MDTKLPELKFVLKIKSKENSSNQVSHGSAKVLLYKQTVDKMPWPNQEKYKYDTVEVENPRGTGTKIANWQLSAE